MPVTGCSPESELDPAKVMTGPITIYGVTQEMDLLPWSWSVRYAEAAPMALRIEIDGVVIAYADLNPLIRTNRTGHQDQTDIESLEQVKRLTEGG